MLVHLLTCSEEARVIVESRREVARAEEAMSRMNRQLTARSKKAMAVRVLLDEQRKLVEDLHHRVSSVEKSFGPSHGADMRLCVA